MFKLSASKKTLRKLGLGMATVLVAVAAGNQAQSHARSHTGEIAEISQSDVQRVIQGDSTPGDIYMAAGPDWLSIEESIVAEHSRVRQNPQSYIPILEDYLASMDAQGNIPGGCGHNCTLLTHEGRPAVEEAIDFLRSQSPAGPVSKSSQVASVAKAHATDQVHGATGHNGSDGSSFFDRLNSFGIQSSGAGENIAYGPTTARDVIMSLIVDDGVPGRGHRTNIFADDWTVAGAGCGPHATFRTVCVINYVAQ
ncbi:CAP domain-containing protein [cf. Phormidesmis sp. LEGE 11477]|uniref:CAP domain-containing protein n=1 Tax=cf. Phormidesmis sp. LEGE 11477 TaxID=1828680 RepID=UPI001880852F|nr:CAP domain-containing protein [cf. Phormidesmis sp. LEGE 11477]MBE9060487.1 CAP domain-containing protein [cf. Phormidesmis sp. LEGE 11477]